MARIVSPVYARARVSSDDRGRKVGTQTAWSGQPQTLLVLKSTVHKNRLWVKLLLPFRPNASSGWVPRDQVVLGRTRYWVEVRVEDRRVAIYRSGKRTRSFGAVVGTPSTPTPEGLAALYERNRQADPGAFLGPWSLPLTVHSNVLENYGGGPGRVGIHGRSGASLSDPIGSARSHGCIRVNNGDISWMAGHVPPGTPVLIR